MEEQIKEKIREIAQSVNETIPVAWDNLYIVLMEEEFIISLMKKGKMSISTISIYQSNIVFLFQNLKKTKDVSLDWLGS